MISVHFQGKPFNITVIQVFLPQALMLKNMEPPVLWRLIRPSRSNNNNKRCPFYHRGFEWKSRKSRDKDLGVKDLGVQNEIVKRLVKFCQENTVAQTASSSNTGVQYQYQIDYILCSQRWRSSIQSAKTRRGADCGSEHELLIVNSGLSWRK